MTEPYGLAISGPPPGRSARLSGLYESRYSRKKVRHDSLDGVWCPPSWYSTRGFANASISGPLRSGRSWVSTCDVRADGEDPPKPTIVSARPMMCREGVASGVANNVSQRGSVVEHQPRAIAASLLHPMGIPRHCTASQRARGLTQRQESRSNDAELERLWRPVWAWPGKLGV